MILVFPIKPLAKQSYRSTKSGFGYQPKDVVDFKNAIRYMATKELPKDHKPLTGALTVIIDFQFALISSANKAQKKAVFEADCQIAKTTKPDIDNLCKAMFDALNGIAWSDDALIVQLIATKCYGKTDKITVICKNEPMILFTIGRIIQKIIKWMGRFV